MMNSARSLFGTQIRGGRVLFLAFCGLAGMMSSIATACGPVNVTEVSPSERHKAAFKKPLTHFVVPA